MIPVDWCASWICGRSSTDHLPLEFSVPSSRSLQLIGLASYGPRSTVGEDYQSELNSDVKQTLRYNFSTRVTSMDGARQIHVVSD